MKKIYKNPEIKIVKFHTTKMIAASIGMYGQNATSAGLDKEDDDEDSFGW